MTAKEAKNVIVGCVIPNFDKESLFGSYVIDALNMAIFALEKLNNSNQEVKKASDADRILKILESAKDKNGDVPMSIVRKAFDKLLPSAQPDVPDTNVGDMVSRQAAFDIINVYAEPIQGYIGTPNDSEVYAYARGLLLSIERNIRALPSAQPDGEYISQQAVTESDLIDWYINSVDESEPVWTEEHIYELFNDFYLIPKENR